MPGFALVQWYFEVFLKVFLRFPRVFLRFLGFSSGFPKASPGIWRKLGFLPSISGCWGFSDYWLKERHFLRAKMSKSYGPKILSVDNRSGAIAIKTIDFSTNLSV